MNFTIGQTFELAYPPEAADWCNKNGCRMARHGASGFTIEELPDPTEEELRAGKLEELRGALDASDYLALREQERAKVYPNYEPDLAVYGYREYLRQFNHGEGQWWAREVLDLDGWKAENASPEGPPGDENEVH
jgi:hypothetical protein